jgi:hypothetical protein
MSKLIGTLKVCKHRGWKWDRGMNLIGEREDHLHNIANGEKPIFSDSVYICGFGLKDRTHYDVMLGKREMGTLETFKHYPDYNYYEWKGKYVSRNQFFLNKKKLFERYNNKKHSLSKRDLEEVKTIKRDLLELSR